jgi:hypothetical protein
MASQHNKPKPGTRVVLKSVPAGFLEALPARDKRAITGIVGKPVLLVQYDEAGRAELEFTDEEGVIHSIYVKPEFIRSGRRTHLRRSL